MEAGRLVLDRTRVHVRGLVESTLDVIAPLVSGKAIDLVHHLDDDVPAVILTDGPRLRQVLVNLLSNAVKFTEAGAEGHIVARARPAGDGGVMVELEDDGPGIPEHLQGQVFEPFMTTKPPTPPTPEE